MILFNKKLRFLLCMVTLLCFFMCGVAPTIAVDNNETSPRVTEEVSGGDQLSPETVVVPETPVTLPPADTSPPADTVAPTWANASLTADSITRTGATLTWTPATDDVGVTGYNIYKNNELLTNVNGTEYIVESLEAGKDYSFKVEAGDVAGNWSTDGPSASLTTLAADEPKQPMMLAAAAPGEDTTAPVWTNGTLTASNITKTGLTLSWTGASDDTGVTGYKVYVNQNEPISITGTSYDLSGLTAATPYTFKVEAGDAAGLWSTTGPTTTATTLVAGTIDTRVTAYLTVVNSDNTSTTGEAITGDFQVPLKPVIKLKFSSNVVANAAQNVACISLLDSSGQAVPNVEVFTLGTGASTHPEKNNMFVRPNDPLAPGSTYKIVVSPEVLFKNNSKLGEPAVEVTFTTMASAPEVTLVSAVLSGQTLTLTGLPADANLEYRVITDNTASDWNALTYTGTEATVDASALAITSGVSQVEVRSKDGQGTTAGKTVYLAVDGNKTDLINNVSMVFEDNVTVAAENLNPAGNNQVSIKRYVIPIKYYIDPVGFGYEVYLQGAGDGKKATLSFPVDPSRDINKMSVFALDKSLDTTADKSDTGKWCLKYLVPDRSQAAKNIISITAEEIPEAGGTFAYQVFYDDVCPYVVSGGAGTCLPEANQISLTAGCWDNDYVDRVEFYREGKLIGTVNQITTHQNAYMFIDEDPTLQAGKYYNYRFKVYDRMGNSDERWVSRVMHDSSYTLVDTVRQQLEDGTIPLGFAPGDSVDHVVTDFELPLDYTDGWGINIKWVSSDPDFIRLGAGDDIAHVVKSTDGSDKEVTLTATISHGNAQATVIKKLRVTWEPWAGGVMPVRTTGEVRDTMFELWRALDQDNIKTIIIKDGLGGISFLNRDMDLKGKTLIVGSESIGDSGYEGVYTVIKNGVIDANGCSMASPIIGFTNSHVVHSQSKSGLYFENVEFKGGENLDCFILSQGGGLILNNCRFSKTKVTPVITVNSGVADPINVRIENCTFDGANQPGYAVSYDKLGELIAINNTITGFQGTTAGGMPSAGFLIASGRNATLTGNKISNCDNGILVQTRSAANTTINDIKITNIASAAAAGTALLESNELTAGSGPVVAINNVDSIFHPVVWYQAAEDTLTASQEAPVWGDNKTLTAGDIDETELTLTWSEVGDPTGVTSYRVYQGADLIATVSDTTYRVTNLLTNQTYQFRVEAGNARGQWSINGPTATAHTLANTPPVWPEGSQVTVTGVGPNSVILSWTPATDKAGVRSYLVYVNGAPTQFWTGTDCLSSEVFCDFDALSLQPDTEYTFQIYAEDSSREQSPGPSVTARTLNGPATNWVLGRNRLDVSNLHSTGLTLNWERPAPISQHGKGIQQYKLMCNDSEVAMSNVSAIKDCNTSTYDVTGLQPGTAYTFKLEVMEDRGDPAGCQWSTDGPSITVTTPEQNSHNGQLGQAVDIYMQSDAPWANLISDVQLDGKYGMEGTSVIDKCTVIPGHIRISAGAFTEARTYTISIRATGYPDAYITQTILPGETPVVTGQYNVIPLDDRAYTKGKTDSGIDTMTVNQGVSGLQNYTVNISPVTAHEGNETAVFVQLRDGLQINMDAVVADFESVNSATAGFNVQAGDVIKVFIVDELSNAANLNPYVLQ
ncbi:MAG: fibronectin type III domain-containing protein [Syntrophomonadaceae bacterium]